MLTDPVLLAQFAGPGALGLVAGFLLLTSREKDAKHAAMIEAMTNKLIEALTDQANADRDLAASLAVRAETERGLAESIRGLTEAVKGSRRLHADA